MNIEQMKAHIADLQAKRDALKAGDQTAATAAEILAIREEIKTAKAELAVLVEAFEGDDADEAEGEDADAAGADGGDGVAAGDDAGAGDGAGEDAGTGTDGGDAGDAGAGDAAGTAPVSLAASGADVSPTAGSGDAAAADAPKPMTLTASASTGGVNAGTKLERADVQKILQQSLTAGGSVSSGHVRMFEINQFGADVDTPGDHHNAIDNTRMIAAARERKAAGVQVKPVSLTAGGCFCGPDELIKETGVVGRRGRPVAGIFPSIPISGGFRAMPDLAFNVDNVGSTTLWTCDDQDAVDPLDSSTWKPCTELDCFSEQSYVPYMVVACTTVRRQHRWAHPEQVDAWINLLGIEYDSVAETLLLDKIELDAGAPLTIGAAGSEAERLGLLAKLHYALGSLSLALGYQFRDTALEGYTALIPRGMWDAVYADEKIRGFPSGVKTKQEIRSDLESSYGVSFVERLDEATSQKAAYAATVTAINGSGEISRLVTSPNNAASSPLLPPNFRVYLIPTDQYVHGEGVLVGADWHVDIDLLRQNKLQYFLENVEILENLGVKKPHIIDVPANIMGSYVDLVEGPYQP